MQVKPYKEKYKEQFQQVCIDTGPIEAYTDIKTREVTLTKYVNYYIEKESNNCFALVDENDNAQGYIVCAENYEKYKVNFAPYKEIVKKLSKSDYAITLVELIGYRVFSRKFPAHLHININEGFRGSGNGTKLMETLISHLKNKSIRGIMLMVATSNKSAINFYKKNGFKKVFLTKQGIVMGKSIF